MLVLWWSGKALYVKRKRLKTSSGPWSNDVGCKRSGPELGALENGAVKQNSAERRHGAALYSSVKVRQLKKEPPDVAH
jgi:hypothetical protein